MKRLIKTGDEQDAYTKWRSMFIWRSGEIKKIKKRTHRRERRENKQWINEQLRD
jgi:hypothetical protein